MFRLETVIHRAGSCGVHLVLRYLEEAVPRLRGGDGGPGSLPPVSWLPGGSRERCSAQDGESQVCPFFFF